MYFVVSEKDVTTHALISVFRIFLRMTRVHVFLSMLEVTLSGPFATMMSMKIQGVLKTVSTWKRRHSFLCDFLVFET